MTDTRRPGLVVFSDLDGTLLDHHTYSFEPALPVLRALRERGIPLVLATSKTVSELEVLRTQLAPGMPAVAENGGHVLIPAGYFEGLRGESAVGLHDQQVHLGADYASIRAVLRALRQHAGHRFRGFGDMEVHELAQRTGLSADAAARAKRRESSEPLLWQGDAAGLASFRSALEEHGLRLNRGGRFFHVQAQVDKADGLTYLMERYQEACGERPPCIAAGDGENDLGMLRAADHAIVIPPGDPTHPALALVGTDCTLAHAPGPEGLCRALLGLLDHLETRS